MTCPRTEDLSAFIDHALPARRQAVLQRHLQACPVCRRQLDAMRSLRQELKALRSPTLGFDLAAQLQDHLPRHASKPRRFGRNLLGWMPAGLATGAALVSGLWLGGLLLGTGTAISTTVAAARPVMARVFDPVPPGGLCTATEICRLPRALP